MPRMTENQAGYFNAKKAVITKQLKLLSYVDLCFYFLAFFVLIIMPVNVNADTISSVDSETGKTNLSSSINIYAAELSDELKSSCKTNNALSCALNVVSQKELLNSIITADTSGAISVALDDNDYEVLIGSAMLRTTVNSTPKRELILEVSTQWRGISIDDVKLSLVLSATQSREDISHATISLLSQWTKKALTAELFDAKYLYQFLGASDYQKELKVPSRIGDFELSRQHLYKDPMKGMLSRYIHKDFELAVFDIYVYPLKTSDSIAAESRNELLREQNDIQTISQSLGEAALTMTDIYELESINGTQIFAFEASLQTKSDPMFATQYIFVKNDKVVKFSANVPARITDTLIAQAIVAIQVPAASSLMQQMREPVSAAKNAAWVSKVAP